jgi:hypothetical protein
MIVESELKTTVSETLKSKSSSLSKIPFIQIRLPQFPVENQTFMKKIKT